MKVSLRCSENLEIVVKNSKSMCLCRNNVLVTVINIQTLLLTAFPETAFHQRNSPSEDILLLNAEVFDLNIKQKQQSTRKDTTRGNLEKCIAFYFILFFLSFFLSFCFIYCICIG